MLVGLVIMVVVLVQLKRDKKGITQTLNHSWVIQISLPRFRNNIVEQFSEPAIGNCCNSSCSNQGCTREVHILFGSSLGKAQSKKQTCE
jgi:hypothetical protein